MAPRGLSFRVPCNRPRVPESRDVSSASLVGRVTGSGKDDVVISRLVPTDWDWNQALRDFLEALHVRDLDRFKGYSMFFLARFRTCCVYGLQGW